MGRVFANPRNIQKDYSTLSTVTANKNFLGLPRASLNIANLSNIPSKQSIAKTRFSNTGIPKHTDFWSIGSDFINFLANILN